MCCVKMCDCTIAYETVQLHISILEVVCLHLESTGMM